MLLLPLSALADTPAPPAPPPMPAPQRATEAMVLELTRLWQRQGIATEQAVDALKEAQQNAETLMKESKEKDLDLQRKAAHIFELEELTSQLQVRLAQLQKKPMPANPAPTN